MLVEKVTTREVATKFGDKPVYTLHTDSGQFENGFTKPTCKVGDEVEFTFTESKYGKQIDKGSMRVIRSGGGKEVISKAEKREFVPTAPKAFPIPPLHPDRSVVRQNALRHAAVLIAAKLDPQGPLEIEALGGQVIELARMFEAYSCGDIELAVAIAEVNKESK
jgi:hypothetical protein